MPAWWILLGHLFFSAQEPSPELDRELLDACRGGHPLAVEKLLKQGADVNAREVLPEPENDQEPVPSDWDEGAGGTALILASAAGHREVVQILLRAGADVNAVDERGWPAILRAAYFGHGGIVRALLESGASPDLRETYEGATALHFAARQNHPETVRLLLDAGASPNAVLRNGWTPLMWAVERGSPEIVRMLIEAGADPNASTSTGVTARQWAKRRGDPQILALLGPEARPK
jgi:ankyrin repeat protein